LQWLSLLLFVLPVAFLYARHSSQNLPPVAIKPVTWFAATFGALNISCRASVRDAINWNSQWQRLHRRRRKKNLIKIMRHLQGIDRKFDVHVALDSALTRSSTNSLAAFVTTAYPLYSSQSMSGLMVELIYLQKSVCKKGADDKVLALKSQ
jgi:hypothetical protein